MITYSPWLERSRRGIGSHLQEEIEPTENAGRRLGGRNISRLQRSPKQYRVGEEGNTQNFSALLVETSHTEITNPFHQ